MIAADDVIDRLSKRSVNNYWNPYTTIEWPQVIDPGKMWMDAELLTIYDTEYMETCSEKTLIEISKWESVNFYSLNIHGIREALVEVALRVDTPDFQFADDFLHHFLGEENEHMWFFAKLCKDYAGKIYRVPDIKMFEGDETTPEERDLVVFINILIFEEIVEYINMRVGRSEVVPPIIRQVNWLHHLDESRHVAFGRRMVVLLHQRLMSAAPDPDAARARLDAHVRGYMARSIDVLYRADVYRDAGCPEPFRMRNVLRQHPARRPHHNKMLGRAIGFLREQTILRDGEVVL